METIHGKAGGSGMREVLGISIAGVMCLIAALICPVRAETVYPTSPEIRRAMEYLKTCQRPDGGFGLGGATEWVIMAVAAAGQDPRKWYRCGRTPMDYLQTLQPSDNPYDWIRMALALRSVNENPGKLNDCITKIERHYKQGQFGDSLSLRDDYWALLALASAGKAGSEQAQKSARFILQHQNADGSWSASTTGVETCADNTAIAIVALVAAGYDKETKAIRNGLAYLKSVQQHDGGFSYLFVPSNAASDAWVIQALRMTGVDPLEYRAGEGDVMAHLKSLQQPDGSFGWTNNDVNSPLLMTAYAILALAGKGFPVAYEPSGMATVRLRVEGEHATLLDKVITLECGDVTDSAGIVHPFKFFTPLALMEAAARREGAGLRVDNTPLGLYLRSFQEETGGWQFRINDRLPMNGAHMCRLSGGEEVVWFYDIQGCRSPLRLSPQQVSGWEGDKISFFIERFDDCENMWKPVSSATLDTGERKYSIKEGKVMACFEKQGRYAATAKEDCSIRSETCEVTIHRKMFVRTKLIIQDQGKTICDTMVEYCGLDTTDMNSKPVRLFKPVLLGALEAASEKGLITYRVVSTSEGIILVDINGLVEDNQCGSWWFQVNNEQICDDVDESIICDGDVIRVYRSRHP